MMSKLNAEQAYKVLKFMFLESVIDKDLAVFRDKLLTSISKDVVNTLCDWDAKKYFNPDSPIMVDAIGVILTGSHSEREVGRALFSTPLRVPAVGSAKSEYVGEAMKVRHKTYNDQGVEMTSEAYLLRVRSDKLYSEEGSPYKFSKATNKILKDTLAYKADLEKSKDEARNLLKYYTGKAFTTIQKEDPYLHDVITEVLGTVKKESPVPDNLADIVNASKTIQVPKLKRLESKS